MSTRNPTFSPLCRASVLLAANVLAAALAGWSTAATAAEDGLRWHPHVAAAEADGLSHWQGRFGLATQATEDAPWGVGDAASRLVGASLMGDYYFSRSAFRQGGGFRATGGVLLGNRNPLWSGALGATQIAPGLNVEHRNYSAFSGYGLTGFATEADGSDSTPLPYVGIGYTGLFGKRLLTGQGWGFSADLGLMSRSPGSAVRLGNVFGGQQTAGELVRELQLNPMLHLGVSYAF